MHTQIIADRKEIAAMARIGGFTVGNSKVYLNVYDLNDNNEILYPWGLGMYHSGVQIGREEYTFAASAGIFHHDPKGAPGAKFRESIDMGEFKGTSKDIETIIQSLRPQFGGNDYHLLNRNCNSFANELVKRLLGKEIPGYVNRMAHIGSYFSCLLPPQMAGNAPVDNAPAGDSYQSDSNYGSAYRPQRLQNNSGAKVNSVSSASSTSTGFSSAGKKLGGSSDSSAPIGLQERRQRMLSATTNRLN